MTITEEKITITCADTYPLGALLLKPERVPLAILQFQGGTGVKKEFYLHFCRFLAGQGYAVVMFDYRGVGESRPQRMRGFGATLQDWPRQDMTAVLNWCQAHYPDTPKLIVSHSIGGQLIGLMPNHDLLSGVVTIASSVGSWRLQSSPRKYTAAFLWYVVTPLTTSLFGYGYLKRLGIMEDLPAPMLHEWRQWCTNDAYLSPFLDNTILEHYFAQVRIPYKNYHITDDWIANETTVNKLLTYYPNAKATIRRISPQEYGVKKIGHFGFFSRKFTETLWTEVVTDIEQMLTLK